MLRRCSTSTASILAPLSFAAKRVSRHPRITALVLVLLLLAVTGVGLPCYAYHRWHAAQAAVKEGRLAEARGSLDFCLIVWPRSLPVHLLAARAARLSGDFAGAEAQLNQCLKLHNGATEATQLEFLLMRVQQGEVDEVSQPLMLYVENKDPETPLILETLSRSYMHDLRYRPAYACLTRWIQEAPDAAQPLFWRGWVQERLSDSEGAVKDYQQALELDPDLTAARLRLAEILLERSNPPEALPHLERLRQQYPNRPDVLARLGECRLLQGRPEEARPLLEAAVKQLPDDPLLLVALAKLELADERPVEAESWLRHLLKADPFDVEAEYTLVSSLQLQGRREEAAALLDQYLKHKALLTRANRLLKEEADHPTNDAGAAAEIGALFLSIGQEHVGLYWLHQALQRDPVHQSVHKALAEYYEKKGEKEQAETHRRWLTQANKKAAAP